MYTAVENTHNGFGRFRHRVVRGILNATGGDGVASPPQDEEWEGDGDGA
jgi:hypothetical protein